MWFSTVREARPSGAPSLTYLQTVALHEGDHTFGIASLMCLQLTKGDGVTIFFFPTHPSPVCYCLLWAGIQACVQVCERVSARVVDRVTFLFRMLYTPRVLLFFFKRGSQLLRLLFNSYSLRVFLWGNRLRRF
jgi:hypothetical protein